MIAKPEKIKKWPKKKFPAFSIILFCLIIAFLFFSNWKLSKKRAELSLQKESLEKEIKELEERNQKLNEDIADFSTEANIERTARERLGLKKPGEEVVVVLPLPENIDSQEKKEQKGNWEELWDKVLEKIKFRQR